MTLNCPHCGIALANKGGSHTKRCPQEPTIRHRTITALRTHAADGVIMLKDEYECLAVELKLPSSSTLHRSIGTWVEVAHWAGLDARTRNAADTPAYYANLPTFDDNDDLLPCALPCIARVRQVRAWDWRRKCYVVVGTEEVLEVR